MEPTMLTVSSLSKPARTAEERSFPLVSQYAGKDKWEAEIKKAVNLLTTLKWKGSQNFPFEKHGARLW